MKCCLSSDKMCCLIKLSIISTLIVVFAAIFISILFPFTSKPFNAQEYILPSPKPLIGTLSINNFLTVGKRILENEIIGPEALVVEGNTIYATTFDDKQECGTYETETKCGRPLGIRRYNKDILIVIDSYYGIYFVDFSRNIYKKGFELFLSSDELTKEKPAMMLNDFDIINNEDLYISDSSSKWDRRRFFHILSEAESNGRILKVNLKTKNVSVFQENLFLPNGVQQISEDSIIVAECGMARIWKMYISGDKKGHREIFIENLPGLPDNIRLSKYSKTFYVGLTGIRHSNKFNMYDEMGKHKTFRNILAKILPEKFFSKIPSLFVDKHSILIEINSKGEIISSYQDPQSTVVEDVSHVADDEKYLYLGSYHSKFIVKVPKIIV
ncbi:Six-bladed beta-propeller, TolB-like domain and Strictosidine synthase, conserved region domain-containing protein [Strongyloides ratti]|uniref:Six-bladed beta-propeller, TolB-like domain and Strictosidine synthase, conserved region domain-containing protein n=1 Tax=Strongyloides ratti TaxID=34506 RepID=A0A090LLJ0_STRRB|nr:Six-bladed beta-propeller, TolB-like domain and Strictosidine synthase, conserved region domain-containing protein [Strongyloides ratti]CEF70675.1 Six-bladed beta-propeller, TolB-like domain and Strictosidine synthase, conserved region domain-containing protein [Strongyloides ratti]